jgi:hypothetical protein
MLNNISAKMFSADLISLIGMCSEESDTFRYGIHVK